MTILALVAGIILILLGIAGFAKLLAIAAVYGMVLIVVGALLALYGVTRRSPLFHTRPTTGRDMRDV